MEKTDLYYIIGGDLLVGKQDFIENYLAEGSSVDNSLDPLQKHFVTSPQNIITRANATAVIQYFIHADVRTMPASADWVAAIAFATAEWNNLPNTTITLQETNTRSEAEFVIFRDNGNSASGALASGTYAAAFAPVNGSVNVMGLTINDNGPASNAIGKRFIIKHELGHILGFGHSDKTEIGLQSYVHCTPDLNSVMVSNVASPLNVDRVFSAGDMAMIRNLYATSYTTPVLNVVVGQSQQGPPGSGSSGPLWNVSLRTNVGNTVDLRGFNFDIEEKSYSLQGTLLNTRTYPGGLVRTDNDCSDNEFITPIIVDRVGNNTCYRWRVRARNRKGDFTGTWSNQTSQVCLN